MGYEFDGEKYRKAFFGQKNQGNAIIDALQLRGDERVLDLGCGDGALTQRLAQAVPNGRVVGIDASLGMLEAARRHVADNLSFAHIYMREMEFDGQFDLIFSNAALHWIHDHEALLSKVYTALAPNGRIRFAFAGEGNSPCLIDGLRETMDAPRFRGLFESCAWPWRLFGEEEYKALLSGAGFGDCEVMMNTERRLFADCDAARRWIEQPCIVPFLAHLESEEDKRAFQAAATERVLGKMKQESGEYWETFNALHIY